MHRSLILPAFLLLCLNLLPSGKERQGGYVGSSTCGGCHAAIFKKYSVSPMARTSGKVGSDSFQESLKTAKFTHAASGARYRVFRSQEGLAFEYSRRDPLSNQELRGERRLDYYIGSGAVGRSYALAQNGFLFQAPVSYYSAPAKWEVSPGYQKTERIHLTRALEPDCLNCHASRLQHIAGTQNGYETVPFLEGGVGCERCHGPGASHTDQLMLDTTLRARAIVNPSKLAPELRDGICAQCHLTGEARVARKGRSLTSFQPGDRLADHVVSFVWSAGGPQELKVTSHFEKLWQSQCKKTSGDRLWCGTCHDPHSVPTPEERKEFFRQKCLSCHHDSACESPSKLREQSGDDCAFCHMPKGRAADAVHSVYTDHAIPRSVARARARNTVERKLVPFWDGTGWPRELGLAYAEVAVVEQKEAYFAQAQGLLQQTASEIPADPPVLEQLAFLHDRKGEDQKAVFYYEGALSARPAQVVSAINLGALHAKRGDYRRAIALWEDALERNPGLELPRIYLAQAYLRLRNSSAARSALHRALEYNPDSIAARRLLSEIK